MIRIGIIGLGADWESRVRPALERSRGRLRIAAVHAPVAERAEAVASQFGAAHVDGIVALTAHDNVDAVLVLDVGPLGLQSLQLAKSAGKPVMVLGPVPAGPRQLAHLAAEARDSAQLLVPALGHRYTPSTGRLRELTATTLGQPHHVVVDAPQRGDDALARACDWSAYVLQAAPRRVRAEPTNGHVPESLDECRIVIEFEARDRNAVAELRPAADRTNGEAVEVTCENGTVRVDGPEVLRWNRGQDPVVAERLDDERPDIDVMLDHFCRRVVGGLVPVPDFDDVGRVRDLCAAAGESLRSGQPVDVGSTARDWSA